MGNHVTTSIPLVSSHAKIGKYNKGWSSLVQIKCTLKFGYILIILGSVWIGGI
jgi:hypothetical protein